MTVKMTLLNKAILQFFILQLMVNLCEGGCDFFDSYASDNMLVEGKNWTCTVGTPPLGGNCLLHSFMYQILKKNALQTLRN